MVSLQEIVETIQRHRSELKGFGVKELGIFGSFARGDQTTNSDIDFLVELEKTTFRAYMGLCFYLEELFGRSIDVVLRDSIKERMREKILQEVRYVEGI
jgi:predicted nucleotidyltransferase